VELLTGERPYAHLHATPVQVAMEVADGNLYPAIPSGCNPRLAAVLYSCFAPDPLSRPSFTAICMEVGAVCEEVAAAATAAAAGKQGEGMWGATAAALRGGAMKWFNPSKASEW
jgi:hypothetical protein